MYYKKSVYLEGYLNVKKIISESNRVVNAFFDNNKSYNRYKVSQSKKREGDNKAKKTKIKEGKAKEVFYSVV